MSILYDAIFGNVQNSVEIYMNWIKAVTILLTCGCHVSVNHQVCGDDSERIGDLAQ